jgi:hypothetical protein
VDDELLAKDNPAFLNDLASALNNLGNRYSETGQRERGARRWSDTLALFATDRPAAIVLRLRRVRGDDELDEAIDDVIEAHAIDNPNEPTLTAEVHAAARSARHRDPEGFDTRWMESAGPPPDWLRLDEKTLETAIAWIDTPTWTESRALFTANAGRLLAAGGETALGTTCGPAQQRIQTVSCRPLGRVAGGSRTPRRSQNRT